MGLNVSDGVLAALAAAAGAAILKVWEFFFPSKKETVETKVLLSSDDREREKFWERQLTALEKRFIILQKEGDVHIVQLKALRESFNEMKINYNAALTEITFLKIELAAYKT